MAIPGSNLLNKALRVIRAQDVTYVQNSGRIKKPNGVYETEYNLPVTIKGSVQAVPLSNYKALGLDLSRSYVTLYTNTPIVGVERDVSGDLFSYNGKVYQAVSTTNWLAMDGWNQVTAVQVDTALPASVQYVIDPVGDFIVTPQGDFIIAPI